MSGKKRKRHKGTQPAAQPTPPGLTRSKFPPRVMIGIAVLVAVAFAVSAYFWRERPAGVAETPPSPSHFIAGADLGYVDPVACIGCHQEIYETYRLTGMGRSFYRPTGVCI